MSFELKSFAHLSVQRNKGRQICWQRIYEISETARSEYAYNADDQLTRKIRFENGSAAGEEHYVYDGSELAIVFDEAGNLTRRLQYGPLTDQLIYDEVFDALGQSDDLLLPLGDHQNSTRLVYGADHALRQRIDYSAFGEITHVEDGSGTAQSLTQLETDLLWQGQLWDDDAGLYSNGQRWYDPGTARFASEDPLGFAAGDPNLFRRTGNDPLNFIDPTGLLQAGNPLSSLTGSIGTSISSVANSIAGFTNSAINVGAGILSVADQARPFVNQFNAATTRINSGISGEARLIAGSQRSVSENNVKNIIASTFFDAERIELSSNPQNTQRVSVLGNAGRGLGTGLKVVGNAGVDTAVSFGTLGAVDNLNFFGELNDFDRAVGGETAALIARGSTELAFGLATGGLGTLNKIGKGVLIADTLGNAANVGRGVINASQNGLSFSNSVQIVGGGFGLGGNIATGGKVLGEIAGDVSALRGAPRGVNTPHGVAVQGTSPAALQLQSEVATGRQIFRGGNFPRSAASDAQFFSPRHPLSPGFADDIGAANLNAAAPDFIMGGRVRPGGNFVTRPAPGLGNNAGGGLEIVNEQGVIQFDFFVMPDR